MDSSERYSEARKITLFGAAKNSFLAFIKIVFGILGHSHALFADGIHSLSDLVIDGLVLIASRFGSKEADSDHPYGHGRIETAAILFLAFILALAGVGIIVDACDEIFGFRTAVKPDLYVIVIALISVFVNEILYFYTRRVGERVQSNLLISNAWHHRSDSATSLIVVLGVGGAWLGFPRLDAFAAAIVGLMIIKMAFQFGWNSIRELVDTGLEEDLLDKIRANISKVPGVQALHQLRTRSIAGAIFLDVHIIVDPLLSVSEGHFIGQQVHFRLLKDVPGIADVIVHIDPEDDEISAPSRNLPSRQEIIELLKAKWRDLLPKAVLESNNFTLHYLNGKVLIDLRLPLELVKENTDQLKSSLKQAVHDIIFIDKIQVLFH